MTPPLAEIIAGTLKDAGAIDDSFPVAEISNIIAAELAPLRTRLDEDFSESCRCPQCRSAKIMLAILDGTP